MIELAAGDLTLVLAPEIGGSIAAFRKGGIDVMRALTPERAAKGDVLGVASFPMLPYANRIDGNRFTFEGVTYRFEANNGAERFNVHGTGWHSAWEAERLSDTTVEMTLERRVAGEPYQYRATQRFELSAEGLTLSTTLENIGPVRMPFGFGHHPWFDRDADVELTFAARNFWLEAPDGVAGSRITTPPELDFSNGAGLPPHWRNNDYSGWDGRATLRFPKRGVTLVIEADPIFENLMLYADPKQSFFCLEPQTNVPCAANKFETGEEGLGLVVLAPGEGMDGVVRFGVR
ncbi:aldose 1-epimerase [Kaistia nematophila]|uniref:Aldose 1-epimerase n=1 Tax=Kaistia nematophila TaxID=2994654 RepID=A0A9X3IJT0_9HYPH|nr:aldose 1-epimerase [Kaistia nematophila]MCX5568909.1 aldose 1-epimerase [Kaistia nematophila]